MQGMISLVLGTLALSVCNDFWSLYLGVSLFSFASSVVVSCLTSITSFYAKKELRGTELGKLRSYGQLGRALGPIFVSALYWTQGSLVCYAIVAGLVLLPILQLRKVSKIIRSHADTHKKN